MAWQMTDEKAYKYWKKKIIEKIREMSGRVSEYQVFSDWVELMAIAIANQSQFDRDKIWEQREDRYKSIIKSHDAVSMSELQGMLVFAMECKMGDVLGEIYMEGGMGSKAAGQFFTPFHLSELCAKLVSGEESDPLTINEPACGSGGMIIAKAKDLIEKGINFQKNMDVVAQDLDSKAVYMCYVQLSLYGIRGIVIQGDTLGESYTGLKDYDRSRVWITPAKKGLFIW